MVGGVEGSEGGDAISGVVANEVTEEIEDVLLLWGLEGI